LTQRIAALSHRRSVTYTLTQAPLFFDAPIGARSAIFTLSLVFNYLTFNGVSVAVWHYNYSNWRYTAADCRNFKPPALP
jgi:hypothetical protein